MFNTGWICQKSGGFSLQYQELLHTDNISKGTSILCSSFLHRRLAQIFIHVTFPFLPFQMVQLLFFSCCIISGFLLLTQLVSISASYEPCSCIVHTFPMLGSWTEPLSANSFAVRICNSRNSVMIWFLNGLNQCKHTLPLLALMPNHFALSCDMNEDTIRLLDELVPSDHLFADDQPMTYCIVFPVSCINR